jgi:hypothetical protein
MSLFADLRQGSISIAIDQGTLKATVLGHLLQPSELPAAND